MARRRSRLKGGAELRRSLRQMPEDVRREVGDELQGISARLLGRARSEAPARSGTLRGALAARVLPRSLQLKLGLITKAAQRKGWYGYILDKGRKAQTVRVKRRSPGTGNIQSYMMRVRPIARERFNFVFGRRRDFMRNELDRLRDAVQRALRRASGRAM